MNPARACVLCLALAGLLACASPAHTSTATLPPAVAADAGAPLQPTGRGRMTFWGLSVYDAALWAAPAFRPEDFAAHPFVLELQYLRDFSAEDIARVSLEQMRRHGRFDEAQAARWQAQLAALLPPVRRGDRIAGLNLPGQGARFFHNGRPVGDVPDGQFARLFFAIWLGEATSEPALRQALLARTP